MTDYTVRPPMARSKGKRKNAFIRFLTAVFPAKGDPVPEMIRKVVFIVAVAAFVITGGTLLKDVIGEVKQKYIITDQVDKDKANGTLKLTQEQIDKIKSEKPYIRADLMGLYEKNNDFVGWFNLGGEDKIIDYPVVQAEDDRYLEMDFYGNYLKSGTLFVDSRCKFDENGKAPNFVIIYGHNTNSSVMFSKLTRYYYDKTNPDPNDDWTTSYARIHPTITFDTLADKSPSDGTYKVFACCLFNTENKYGEVYNYLRGGKPFTSKDDFNNYILDIMDRSVIFTDVDLQYGDEILCMSTCYFPWGLEYENVRCAIFARKVREGESPEVDTTKVTRNWLWMGWQQGVDRGLVSPYACRQWDTKKLLSLG